MPDPKKLATIILSKTEEAGGEESTTELSPNKEEGLDPVSAGYHAAAEDMMLAMKDGSAHRFTEALRSFLTQMGVGE